MDMPGSVSVPRLQDPHGHAGEVVELVEKLRALADFTRRDEDAQYVRNLADLIEQVMGPN